MSVVGAVLALLLALALLVGWAGWLHRRLAVAPGYPRSVRWASLAFMAGGLVLYGVANLVYRLLDPAPLRPLVWVGLAWLAVAFYVSIGLAVVALGCLVLRLAGRGAARAATLRVATPVVVGLALAVTAYGAVVATRPSVTTYEITDPGLPAGWDGVRIALVTDLHVGAVHGEAWTRRVVALVQAQHPDVVLLGGDLVDGRERYVRRDLAPLARLHAPLGVFAVSGNHEFESGDADAYLRDYDRLGVRVLRNKHVELARGGDTVVLAGVHDEAGSGVDEPDPSAALSGVPSAAYTMLLVHEPRQLVSDAGVDLQLSGHTHGGQLWPFGWLVPFQQPTVRGVDEIGGVTVVTSRGAGTSGPPVRVGSDPEVALVTLHR